MIDIDRFIRELPKTELHLHVEGTLEPGLMFKLGERNGFDLPFDNVDAVAEAYDFSDLQSFLDIYYQGAAVLQRPEDFYELMAAYLRRAAAEGVRHAEVFFDPQTHTERGVPFDVFMGGFRDAISNARSNTGITTDLILCLLRHLSPVEAESTMAAAEPHLEGVIAVGLDSSEVGNPPEPFSEAFRMARELGLRAVAHAGEEGPPEYVVGALDALGVERIDHGVRSLQDPQLVERLRRDQIPLTLCPLSNVALKVVESLEKHPITAMMSSGLLVSVNSDDPAYFGGYVADNYVAVATVFKLTAEDLAGLARNSITSSFLDVERKRELLAEVDSVASAYSDK